MRAALEEWEFTREDYLELKKEKYHKYEGLNRVLERCNKRCDVIETALKALEIINDKIGLVNILDKFGYFLNEEEYNLLMEIDIW